MESLPNDFEYVFLSQVTSPFLSESSFRRGIKALTLEKYDSVFTVETRKTYAWMGTEKNPLNYSPSDIPRTQDLTPLYLETSGFYGFRRDRYLTLGTRINGRHKKIEVGFAEAIDIDYPEDFVLAERMLRSSSEQLIGDNPREQNQWLSILEGDFGQERIKHVVFDLDGVLVDSLPSMSTAWKDSASALGLDIPFNLYKERLGLPFSDICSSLGVSPELVPELTKLYFSHEEYGRFTVYDGVEASLERLLENGVKISVFTSKPRTHAEQALAGLPFSSEILLLTPEDIKSGRGKPAPDGLLEVVAVRGIDPENTVFVGDMEADRECAKRAGIQFFHAAWGYGAGLGETRPSFISIARLTDWCLSG